LSVKRIANGMLLAVDAPDWGSGSSIVVIVAPAPVHDGMRRWLALSSKCRGGPTMLDDVWLRPWGSYVLEVS
jgi:hypothetical protein